LLLDVVGLEELIERKEFFRCGALFVVLGAENMIILKGEAVLIAHALSFFAEHIYLLRVCAELEYQL